MRIPGEMLLESDSGVSTLAYIDEFWEEVSTKFVTVKKLLHGVRAMIIIRDIGAGRTKPV